MGHGQTLDRVGRMHCTRALSGHARKKAGGGMRERKEAGEA